MTTWLADERHVAAEQRLLDAAGRVFVRMGVAAAGMARAACSRQKNCIGNCSMSPLRDTVLHYMLLWKLVPHRSTTPRPSQFLLHSCVSVHESESIAQDRFPRQARSTGSIPTRGMRSQSA